MSPDGENLPNSLKYGMGTREVFLAVRTLNQ